MLGVVLLGSIANLLVLALGGAELLQVACRTPRARWRCTIAGRLVAAAVAGALSLLGWALAERRIALARPSG